MKRNLERILQFMKRPPLWLIFINWALTLLCVAGCILTLVFEVENALVYAFYAFSALSLAFSVYTVVSCLARLKNFFQTLIERNPFTRKITQYYRFRTLLFTSFTFVFNVGYAAFLVVFAVLTRSVWYASLAGYYILLSALRGGLFLSEKYAKQHAKDGKELLCYKLKIYRLCGIAMFVFEIAMSVAVVQMITYQQPKKHSEVMLIVVAARTFIKIISSIKNWFKAKNLRDPQVQAFRNIALSDSAISLLSLQTAMVITFSQTSEQFMLLNAITGAFVCLFTIAIGVIMIVEANIRLKRLNSEREPTEET